MDNILINFTADPDGLQPGIDGLKQLETVDKELAASVKLTADAIVKRDKALSDSSKAGKKDVEGLTTAFTNLGKSAIGGTYSKALTDLSKNLKGTNDEFKKLSLTLDVAKQKLAQLKPDSKEWADLNDQIKAGQEILAIFGKETDNTVVKTKSLKAELRAMKEEIARRQVAGESGADLDALIQKAGSLDDALKDVTQQIARTGSDTRNIEGFVQILGTGVQAVSGMAAAQSLLGDENEDFNKVLAKMNALLVLSNSIQAIQAAFQHESAAATFIANAQRKIAIIQTQLQTAAESESVVVRYAAIVAQKALNAVMNVNPILLVIGAIIAFGAAIYEYTQLTLRAVAAQSAFNQALDFGGKALEADLAGMERHNKAQQELLKNQGATDNDLARQEVANSNLRNKARQEALDVMRKTYNEQVVIDEKSADLHNKLGDQILKVEGEIADETNTAINQVGEARRASYLADLKSATAFSEAKIILTRKNSQAELNAQIAAIRAREAEELKSNPNITGGEAAKIKAAADKEVFELNLTRQKYLISVAKAGVDAQVLTQKQGSREELDFKIQSLQLGRDLELKTEGQSADEKLLINKKYWKDREDLVKTFNQKEEQDVQNGRIAQNQEQLSILQLAGVKDTNEKVVQLKSDLIDEQAALEIIGIKYSTDNEELKRSKIKAVYAKELLDKEELEKQKRETEIIEESKPKIDQLNAEINSINTLVSASGAGELVKRAARKKTFDDQTKLAFEEEVRDKQLLSNKSLTQEQFDANQLDRQRTRDEIEIAQATDKAHQLLEIENVVADQTKKIGDAVFDAKQAKIQRELVQSQELFDKKLISETEFNRRKEILDKRAANAQKQKAVFDIAIELAKGLFAIQAQASILSSNPVTAALAVNSYAQMGLLIGEAAIETALVLASKYREGGVIEGKGSGTSDSNLIWASKGEYVTRASQTGKHKEALEAINQDRFQEYLLKYEMPKVWDQYSMPVIPAGAESQMRIINNNSIDYDKLGDVVAQKLAMELANNPHLSINLDENGFNLSVQTGLQTIEYKNKKLLA